MSTEEQEFIQVNGRPRGRFYIPELEEDENRALEEFREYMLETLGYIINSPKGEIPKEVTEFLGEPPKVEDLPEWINEEGDGVPYVPGLDKKQRKEFFEKLTKQKNKRNERALVAKMGSGVASEKGLGYIIKKLVVEQENKIIQGKFNPISFMILDCIAHKLVTEDKRCKELIAKRAVSKKDLYTVDKIKAIKKELGYEVKVILKDREIKRTLGLEDKLSNKQIFEAVMDLTEISVLPGMYKYDYDSLTKTYMPVMLGGAERFIIGVIVTTTGRVSRRTGYEEHAYCFVFRTELSLTFLKNILNGNIWLKPKKFYRLKTGHQNIINYALPNESGTGYTVLSLEEISRLVDVSHSRTNRRQQQVEKYLDELVEMKFYRRWKKTGRGKKTRYFLYKGTGT